MEIKVKTENQSGGVAVGQVVGKGTINESSPAEPCKAKSFWKDIPKQVVLIIFGIIGTVVTALVLHHFGLSKP